METRTEVISNKFVNMHEKKEHNFKTINLVMLREIGTKM